jgi:isopentenyl diphosphate isomerase/L-lactate dehydrogenase-like FMN-dependent dehydrogenase
VCQAATEHFTSQPNLSFLEGILPPTDATDTATAAAAAAAEASTTQSDSGVQSAEWLSKASSVDLVWLYFALYKHYHQNKCARDGSQGSMGGRD